MQKILQLKNGSNLENFTNPHICVFMFPIFLDYAGMYLSFIVHLLYNIISLFRSLYRFGGQYLDLDTIVMKNISNLGVNFAGAETSDSVANAVMNLDPKTEIGRSFGELFLR